MTKLLSLILFPISVSVTSSFLIQPRSLRLTSQVGFSERPSEYDPRDKTDTSPPSSFDPGQFDIFEGGGWSNNINNPYVAARYVNARRAANTVDDETVDPRDRALASDKASEERMGAWMRARMEEKKAGKSKEIEDFFREKQKTSSEERLTAWKKSNIEKEE